RHLVLQRLHGARLLRDHQPRGAAPAGGAPPLSPLDPGRRPRRLPRTRLLGRAGGLADRPRAARPRTRRPRAAPTPAPPRRVAVLSRECGGTARRALLPGPEELELELLVGALALVLDVEGR